MRSSDFHSLGIDELWSLHERVTSMLTRKVADDKAKLGERLRRLENSGLENPNAISPNRPRRAYPKVLRTGKIPPRNGPVAESDLTGCGRKMLEHFLIAR
jgi:DNA-binding protein H-NS